MGLTLGPWSLCVIAVSAVLVQSVIGFQITVEPVDQVAALHDPVWIDCVADGPELITYSWRVNNNLLPLSENQVIYTNGTLHIRRLTSGDVGVYLCTVTSGGESINSRQATLEMAYIDTTFETNPVSGTLMLGDQLTLSCSIDSLPPANITWTLDGAPVTMGTVEVSSYGESTLTLFPVLYQEKGLYKCSATNPMIPAVIRYSVDANIVIKGQPVFLTSLESAFVPIGYQAKFHCSFYGNPDPTVSWLVHGQNTQGDVTSKEIVASDKFIIYDNGTFLINDITEDDASTYTCTVENAFGLMAESAQLYVTGMPTLPTFTDLPSNLSVQEGADASFLCRCDGNPEPETFWTKSGSRLVSNSKLSTGNGSLILYGTQSTDMDWYTCVCQNKEGPVNKSVYLDVQVGPTVINPPADVLVLEGGTLTLTCVATGNPSPSITWLTPQYGLLQSSVQGFNLAADGSLTVAVVTARDAGMYTCSAVNDIGTDSASAVVKVEAPPQFTLLPVSQSITEGGRVYFHCQAAGQPAPSYLWTKDGVGQVLPTQFTQIYLNNTLAIHKVTPEDAGIYRCLATNKHGQITAVASLTVTIPPYFSISPSNMTVQEGGSVKLYCVALGDPVPVQRWEKDGRLVQDNNVQILPDGSQLTIVGIRRAQFGQYSCVASNMAGTRAASAWISALDVPVLIIAPRNIVVNQSKPLTLKCQGQAVEAPSVRWYREQQGQLTPLTNTLRIKIQNGELFIRNVMYSDEGFYRCVITNSAGEVSATAFVDVQVPPVITSTNSPQSAVSQSVVSLTCQSTGDPEPTLSWASPQGHVIISSPAYQLRDDTLQILSVNQDTDIGKWVCTACNNLGCDSGTVELLGEGVPEVNRLYGNKNAGSVSLTCEGKGRPDPTMTLTSGGQQVQGSSKVKHTIVIPDSYVMPQYTCEARNAHGVSSKTVTVPAQMQPPSIGNIEPGRVTLTWASPDDTGDLPLVGFRLQISTDKGKSWQDSTTGLLKGTELLKERLFNVTELQPFTEYSFRMAAVNILGAGPFSEESRHMTTSGVPSSPTNLVGIAIREDIVLITWDPPLHLNGPKSQIVYRYKVMQPVRAGDTVMVIHSQGSIPSNQTHHIEIADLSMPVVYTFSIWAHNTVLSMAGEPASLTIDMTIPDSQSKTVPEEETVEPDKLIIVLFGVLGGVILVVIIIFVIVHVRHNKKSETHSFTRPRYSLDQFYMENPKDLYDKTEKGHAGKSMRRRSHGFYKFDNDDSLNGSYQREKHHSVISCPENVLLMARNPLYVGDDETNPSPKSEPGKSGIRALSLQYEIEIPNAQTSCQKVPLMSSHTGSDVTDDVTDDVIDVYDGSKVSSADALTPLSVKNLEEDLQRIYGDTVPTTMRTGCEMDPGLEHIYSSIHGDSRRSISQESTRSSSPCSTSVPDTSMQKPPIRVLNPSQLRAKKPQTLELQSSPLDTLADQGTSLSSISYSRTPPVRVASPDSEFPGKLAEQVAHVKPYSFLDDSENHNSVHEQGLTDCYNMCNVPEEINTDDFELPERDREIANVNDLIMDITDDKCGIDIETMPNDIRIDDNYLSDAEIRNEVSSAALY